MLPSPSQGKHDCLWSLRSSLAGHLLSEAGYYYNTCWNWTPSEKISLESSRHQAPTCWPSSLTHRSRTTWSGCLDFHPFARYIMHGAGGENLLYSTVILKSDEPVAIWSEVRSASRGSTSRRCVLIFALVETYQLASACVVNSSVQSNILPPSWNELLHSSSPRLNASRLAEYGS